MSGTSTPLIPFAFVFALLFFHFEKAPHMPSLILTYLIVHESSIHPLRGSETCNVDAENGQNLKDFQPPEFLTLFSLTFDSFEQRQCRESAKCKEEDIESVQAE